jgi:hypothetical protein
VKFTGYGSSRSNVRFGMSNYQRILINLSLLEWSHPLIGLFGLGSKYLHSRLTRDGAAMALADFIRTK